MRLLIGLLLFILSFFGAIWFSKYRGTLIPYPTLIFFGCLILSFVGMALIYISIRKSGERFDDYLHGQINTIKSNSDKIQLHFDCCEFRDGSFYHEVKDLNAGLINVVSPTAFNHYDTVTERVNQSSLLYQFPDSGERFVSGAFPFDSTSLKAYVIQGKVFLLINKFDRTKYLFEIQE